MSRDNTQRNNTHMVLCNKNLYLSARWPPPFCSLRAPLVERPPAPPANYFFPKWRIFCEFGLLSGLNRQEICDGRAHINEWMLCFFTHCCHAPMAERGSCVSAAFDFVKVCDLNIAPWINGWEMCKICALQCQSGKPVALSLTLSVYKDIIKILQFH